MMGLRATLLRHRRKLQIQGKADLPWNCASRNRLDQLLGISGRKWSPAWRARLFSPLVDDDRWTHLGRHNPARAYQRTMPVPIISAGFSVSSREIFAGPPEPRVLAENAVSCTLCQGPADRYHWGFLCRNCGAHGDLWVGHFVDRSLPGTGNRGPHIQNPTPRTKNGRELLRALFPDNPAQVLVDVDYSEMETRLLGLNGQQPPTVEGA